LNLKNEVISIGKKSQRKGRAAEIELSHILQAHGFPVQPGQAVSYGATPDLTGLDNVHIECKRAEQQRLYEWLEQAAQDSQKFGDGLPAVFWRSNRHGWTVTMSLESWLSLYSREQNRT
jgi:Holliday junction resolvase